MKEIKLRSFGIIENVIRKLGISVDAFASSLGIDRSTLFEK